MASKQEAFGLDGSIVDYSFKYVENKSELEIKDFISSGILQQVTAIFRMEISRSSTPEAPPQDLWSSILDSVSSSRSTPSKQILLLGQPSTGKSNLVSALLQKPISDEGKDDNRSDFAIGYDFADVRDEADEGRFQ